MTDAVAVTTATATQRSRLQISLSDEIDSPEDGRKLLVCFSFGDAAVGTEIAGVVNTGLEPLGGKSVYECWWYDGDVEHSQVGNARVAECDDYAVTVLQRPHRPREEFRSDTYEVYHELIAALATTRHRNIVKIWNFFDDINDGEGDDEKYRQFSIGRAQVFEELDVGREAMPAGTAIGTTSESAFTVVALTSRHEIRFAENPRQVSAFHYPRQYGPSSPKFSRGGCVGTPAGVLCLLSGTASIVGHESQHPFDIAPQTGETIENLNRLCDVLSGISGAGAGMALDDDCALRVYLREPKDAGIVAEKLAAVLGDDNRNVVFLNANICRQELMIEIDGARFAATPP